MRNRPSHLSAVRRLVLLAAGGWLWSLSALAFANVPIGAVVENVSLPALGGGEQNLLSDTNVSVFIFLKPGQEHSNQALVEIAECEKELAGKPVHWCAIVSDRVPRAEVEAEVQATGITMPVLIDQGDALYGKFGVVLHPVVGITDPDRRLVAYQPFAKVNYGAVHPGANPPCPEGNYRRGTGGGAQTDGRRPGRGGFRGPPVFSAWRRNNSSPRITTRPSPTSQKSLDQNPTAEAYVVAGPHSGGAGKPRGSDGGIRGGAQIGSPGCSRTGRNQGLQRSRQMKPGGR